MLKKIIEVMSDTLRGVWLFLIPKRSRTFFIKNIRYCGFCGEEVKEIGYADESLSYCDFCETIVEGNTIKKWAITK